LPDRLNLLPCVLYKTYAIISVPILNCIVVNRVPFRMARTMIHLRVIAKLNS